MCIFSARARVANTQIFARGSGSTQFLAYSLKYEANAEMAMVLPLPTPPHSFEEAVRFIDLSGYPEFFADLYAGFPVSRQAHWGLSEMPQAKALKVFDVGSFEASFVPHQRDFARLDARFRLPESVWENLPQYADYGFAVFKLKSGHKDVHPMAFEFPRRDSRVTYFPTVHVHDGQVTPKGDFDHTLFCQLDVKRKAEWESMFRENWQNGNWGREVWYWHPEEWVQEIEGLHEEADFGEEWTAEAIAAKARELRAERPLKLEKTHGLVDAEQPIFMASLHGALTNQDVMVTDNR